jgi:hypothetical protein
LTIHILDENDNHPTFLHSFYHSKLNENNPEKKFLTHIEAFDPDSGENGRLTYEILTNEASFPFYIDANINKRTLSTLFIIMAIYIFECDIKSSSLSFK